MEKVAPPDSLIFDMDGTLWDGVDCYAQGFNDYFLSKNIPRRLSKSDIAGYMGWEQDRFLAATLPAFSYEERGVAYKEIIDYQYQRIASDGGVLYDGVKEGLQTLSKKYKLFIVSNCPEFTIDYFLKWAGLEPFITDSLSHGKNYRHKYENIRFLIAKHRLQQPYYIGDTDGDSQQSRLVPLPFVFVDYGFGATDQFDLRFSSFQKLVDYFV
jgi:phosphoglycolate phosphatase